MKCLKAKTIRAFLDYELSSEDHQEVQEHIKTCSVCFNMVKQETERTEMIKNQLSALDPVNIPELVFNPPQRKTTNFLFRRVAVPLPVLTFLCLLVMGMSIFLVLHRSQEREQRTIQEPDLGSSTTVLALNGSNHVSLHMDLSEYIPIIKTKIKTYKQEDKND